MLLEMFKEFANYFVPLIEARRAEPRDDLITDLIRAEEDDKFSATEAVMFLLSVMVAGNESTTSSVGNTVVLLKENPDQLKLLLEDPAGRAKAAVQESFRLRSPFQFYWRKATCDTTVAGTPIPEGARILVIVGAGNTDPRAFHDPERYDILRTGDQPNLAFGVGHHHCLGVHLATLEAEIAIRQLAPHLEQFALSDEELTFPSSFIVYGYERVLLRRAG
jgi:cytochrome P450